MLHLLWLIPALPFAAFLLLALFGSGMKGRVAGIIATGAVGVSAAVALLAGVGYVRAAPEEARSGRSSGRG